MADARSTTYYNFNKVVLSDKYGVDTYNANLDKIDTAINGVNNTLSSTSQDLAITQANLTTTNNNLATTNNNLTDLTQRVDNLPTTLPNPNALTVIMQDGTQHVYDGSTGITITHGSEFPLSITIGNTELTEQNLISLLALLSAPTNTVGTAVVGNAVVGEEPATTTEPTEEPTTGETEPTEPTTGEEGTEENQGTEG